MSDVAEASDFISALNAHFAGGSSDISVEAMDMKESTIRIKFGCPYSAYALINALNSVRVKQKVSTSRYYDSHSRRRAESVVESTEAIIAQLTNALEVFRETARIAKENESK